MFSRFFIERPILAIVLAVVMLLAGALTIGTLPVSQYPDITPPTVRVSASYPGADAETVAKTVAVPLEQQVNGVEGMMYMSSDCGADGSYGLTITFENGTDIDEAAVKVQNRVALADPQLPEAVKQQGVSVMSESSNIILFAALESDDPERYDALYLTNYANINLTDELSRVPGVGGVGAFGGGAYSMRLWLDPEKMRVREVTVQDIQAAVQSQNMQVSAGSVGSSPAEPGQAFEYTITTPGRLSSPDAFGNIVLRTGADGSVLRLRDVARIELGSQSYSQVARVNGGQAALIGIYQLPGANALDVVKGVQKKLDELAEYFPEGVHYRVLLNSTDFVTESIDDLLVTLLETTLIVMIVILLFLQSWRAVIIPMLTIPVSLIATFAVMKLAGFSINTLTLFGMVLAVAIVVDDAIVVVEDCSRLLDKGTLNPRQAAEKAMSELQGPVVGEVLVLLSVFIPTALVSGITGELYKQFALTIAISTAFSGFNALTFTPAMCALFLKPAPATPRFFLFRWWRKGEASANAAYMKTVGHFVRKPWVAVLLYFLLTGAAFWGFLRWPTSYIPSEDMGYCIASVQLPTGAALDRTDRAVAQLTDSVMKLPAVKNVISVSGQSFLGGGSGSNMGSMFVVLKPWDERKARGEHVQNVIAEIGRIGASMQEPVVFALNPPAIPGLGMSSGLEMQLLDIGNRGPEAMRLALADITEEARRNPAIADVTSLYEGSVPQYTLQVDRDRVKLRGLTLEDVYATLSAFMGGSYVNDFVEFGRVYQVTLKGDAASRSRIADIMNLSVRNASGEMVPFGSFSEIVPSFGAPSVSRYNMYTTASLTATPAKGVSSSDAIKAMEQVIDNSVGTNYSYAWTGEAYQETQSGTTVTFVLILAIVITLLVLAAQYESLTDPVAVIIAMPTAILGTVTGCIFMGQSISIYTQIGIILLLGLSAKNAILIVEYARDYRAAGQDIAKAAMDAGQVRFRPIMMTALAFVFGVLPMLFATGAGAASRVALGTAVVFGMAVNAVVGTLFVPNFWIILQRFKERHLDRFFHGDKGLDAATEQNADKDV
ncbi:MAG: multidrug efflux RND transporter permease subunit [Muribaculaceae bacterium]|nr:multidrug efflux RND transporter permease subunit [Muribaculaceae bacterium]